MTIVKIEEIKTINNLNILEDMLDVINIVRIERKVRASSKKGFKPGRLGRESASMDTKTCIPKLNEDIPVQCPVIRVFEVCFLSLGRGKFSRVVRFF
jgi:hypothetical protein